jgi:hypothetical protein
MTETTSVQEKPLFDAVELEQFDADDVVAGSAIGKMLSILFLYTVIVMSFVTWLTFKWVSADSDHSNTDNTHEAAEHH